MASPAIDAFITFRFLKLLVTPFDKTEAYNLGIIDKRGKVLRKYKTLERIEERQAYTILHRLVFNIKKLIEKVPGGKSRVASYAAALFLLKDTFKEHVEDPNMFEKGLMESLKQQGVEFDDTIVEEVTLDNGKLSKGIYVLTQDVVTTEAENEIDDDEYGESLEVELHYAEQPQHD